MSKTLLGPTLVLTSAVQVFAAGADHRVDQPVYLGKAPMGVNQLINNANRVHGFWVNAEDRFFFSGDASVFSLFLKQYAAIEGIAGHRLIIHPGKGVAKSPWDDGDGKSCDWMLEVAPVSWREGHGGEIFRDKDGSRPKEGEKEYLVELHAWTKGKIYIKKVKFPKGVLVVHEENKKSKKEAPNNRMNRSRKTSRVRFALTMSSPLSQKIAH